MIYSIAAAAAAISRRHNFPLFLNELPFLFFHAGRKSEAWIRKLRGLHFNEEDYISTTKFTFALEVIHDGVSVAKSAGFELRPDTENGTCTVEIDKLATFHDRTVPRRSMKLKQHFSTKSWRSLKMESGEAGLEHW